MFFQDIWCGEEGSERMAVSGHWKAGHFGKKD
jgi:hypothetical protein